MLRDRFKNFAAALGIAAMLSAPAGAAFADSANNTDPTIQTVSADVALEPITIEEANKLSIGKIVFANAGNMKGLGEDSIMYRLESINQDFGIDYEVVSAEGDVSGLCFNGLGCIPITVETYGRSMVSVNNLLQETGLYNFEVTALDAN